jgi:hypothetical protein
MTGGRSSELRPLLLRALSRVARLKISHEQTAISREETGEIIGL